MVPRVKSWATGHHFPDPVLVEGDWRCHDCRKRLRWYKADSGEWRLRHYKP